MKDKSGKSRRKKTKAKKPKPKDKDVPEDQSPDENDESQTPDHSEVGNETDKTSPGQYHHRNTHGRIQNDKAPPHSETQSSKTEHQKISLSITRTNPIQPNIPINIIPY
ncbi:hypothetical protein [Bifidobacterium moukalabense]|jgi:hypothetical protein|uniref:hypothetical protein n=1 Tax=Bifidobacterium moukalabense TaxID=1333651 RepID=UPI0010F62ED5|nr:hypothetical protein [Bifidobacterium moukalabense]